MVSIIEIIANLIIVAFAMAAIALIVALISLAATLFGKKFKPFFKKGLWFTLLAPLLFAYGLSLGGKILSRILERDEIVVNHAILDAAPLLPLPKWLVGPLRYLQCLNVWTCYHWTGFWRWVFHSHYFDVLLDECKKVYPYGGTKAVLDGYKSVYTNKLNFINGNDIHYWHGTKEAFVAKPQVKHLKSLYPNVNVEVFKKMNHGQLLIDCPEEIAKRILLSCDEK